MRHARSAGYTGAWSVLQNLAALLIGAWLRASQPPPPPQSTGGGRPDLFIDSCASFPYVPLRLAQTPCRGCNRRRSGREGEVLMHRAVSKSKDVHGHVVCMARRRDGTSRNMPRVCFPLSSSAASRISLRAEVLEVNTWSSCAQLYTNPFWSKIRLGGRPQHDAVHATCRSPWEVAHSNKHTLIATYCNILQPTLYATKMEMVGAFCQVAEPKPCGKVFAQRPAQPESCSTSALCSSKSKVRTHQAAHGLSMARCQDHHRRTAPASIK